MTESDAKKILENIIGPETNLYTSDEIYVRWANNERTVTIDGDLNPKQLKAIAWWMENKGANE